MTKIDLAYTAGIMDGEGCIYIYKEKNNIYEMRVSVGSTDEWLPMWLKLVYGGTARLKRPASDNWSALWEWCIRTKEAMLFLNLILPYLHLKRPQAEIAIRFESRKKRVGRAGTCRSLKILDEADAILLKSMHSKKGSKQ